MKHIGLNITLVLRDLWMILAFFLVPIDIAFS